MLTPIHIAGKCIASDEELFRNMDLAIARGLPEISAMSAEREGTIAIVGSGPSVQGQLDRIRTMQGSGVPVVAIKDAHDWLIRQFIVPDYGFAIDPQPHRWNCFTLKDKRIHYMIASQCNPAMFDHLADMQVTIWHPYIKQGYFYPPGHAIIDGGTTSGLRAIRVFYVMGWRHFALFGFDSCMDHGKLRVNGTGPKEHDQIIDIRLEPNGEVFHSNLAMVQQAQHFEDQYQQAPGIRFTAYGDGLIPAIIKKREAQSREIDALGQEPDNHRVSFIHSWNADSASYRYRAQIPARELDASLNDLTASTLIFAKPQAFELMDMGRARKRGATVIADFCDDHFEWMYYQEAARLADHITCPTQVMAEKIKKRGREATVVPDPYEFPQVAPHSGGVRLLWFGHSVNWDSLQRILPDVSAYPLRVVSNFPGAIPWSMATMLREFRNADIVILPATEDYKSANRAVEAIRQGCFVVAEPHPALQDFPGIWIGKIKEGIEWVKRNSPEANRRTLKAQHYVTEKYSPRTVASAWKNAIQRPITSGAASAAGPVGSMSI